ncbi:MAG TPA: LysR substrate-binding domain-containing protein [Gemmatimonadales bacterium]|nr:LysR substrate-binding domain-containing protein [Gemmatimonadales bacterium]
MNLRQLDQFLAVAHAGSFTAASADLGVAQPSLTKSIRSIERELGARLFERLPRGVVLTPAGQAFRRHAERVGVQLQDAMREVTSLMGDTSGTVVVGAGPSWLRRLLPQAAANAMKSHPSLRLSVLGGFDDVLVKALRAGALDFVVAELPPEDSAKDLTLQALTSDRLTVLCREGHPLAGTSQPPLGELLAFPWVMPPATTRAQQRLNALFVAADLPPPNIVAETESLAFLLQLLLASDTLTFSVSSTTSLPEAAGTVMLDVPQLRAERSAGIITRRHGWTSQGARTIIEELQMLCRPETRN